MPIFKLKKGPILRWSRGLHMAEAAVAVVVGGAIGGDAGAAYTAAGVLIAGLGWEISNKYTPGWHRYGDMWDWLAFVAGTFVGAGIRAVL